MAVTTTLMPLPKQQFLSSLGTPLVGGKVYTYAAGTTNPKATYTDAAGTIAQENPIQLNVRGEPASPIYWSGNYRVDVRDALGNLVYSVDNYNTDPAGIWGLAKQLLSSVGSSIVGFIQDGVGAILRTTQDKLREIEVSVTDFGADPTGVADSTAAFQKAVDYFQGKSAGYNSPFFTITVPPGTYKIAGPVNIAFSSNVLQLCIESKGARLVGGGANIGLNFNNGGYRNIIRKLEFTNFSTAILYKTNNRNECQLVIEHCTSGQNDIFLDNGSYAESRSTMIRMTNGLCVDTRVFVKHYTDQLTVENYWIYAKDGSYDAPFYLSGDGNVHIKDTFLIPNANQIPITNNSRWIDFVSDPAQGTPGDRTLKVLKLSNVRQSLESARPLIWTFDTCPTKPNGVNQISSITVEDSVCAGTGGRPVVWYKQGYPGSVILRNCKVFAAEQIVAVDPANTVPPVPSVPGAITSHVIMIDEATRLTQTNGNNNASLVDPKLTPFVYDTTAQTSKYKRSIPANIDYRLRAVAAPGAGANKVKVTVPVFFDTENAVSNRDILTFLLVTVSDAYGAIYSSPHYRSTVTSLVTIIGGNNGTALKRIVTTPLQEAKGGISFLDTALPTVFWGSGDTGSADIAVNSSSGTEDNITIVFGAGSASTAWAYLVPLAGLRENQQDLQQFNAW